MNIALLDTNVLIRIFEPFHQANRPALKRTLEYLAVRFSALWLARSVDACRFQ